MLKSLFSVLSLLVTLNVFAQPTTYSRVYTILQSNCAATCHSNANHAGNLNISGTAQNVMTALVNVTPNNTAAANHGTKLVDPGDPHNSYLFRKIHYGLDANLSLGTGENGPVHDTLTAMTQTEREMIRQWILFGADDTSTLASEQVIHDFYVTQGGQPRISPVAPPAPSEGTQVYWGPLFLPVGAEFEYDNKYRVRNAIKADVTRMDVYENPESHHMAVYKYYPGYDTLFRPGMQKVNSIADAAALFYSADVIAQWPNNIDLRYPAGTAYVWDTSAVLNLSYHILNYNDSIMVAEVYMNIYYSPHSNTILPIKTDQIRYGGNNVGSLVIMNNDQDTTFVINQFHPDSAFFWNIISMQAHTHKLGRDFNVYARKQNGTKDTAVYEGSYDAAYTFDQGAYIWDNPPYRQFEPPLQVDMRKGLIHEATYRNNTPDIVGFGLKTSDEMFVTFIVYYKTQFPNGVDDQLYKDNNLKLYPNPINSSAVVQVSSELALSSGELKIYDVLGKEIMTMNGISDNVFQLSMGNVPSGYYIYRLVDNGSVVGTGKIVVQH